MPVLLHYNIFHAVLQYFFGLFSAFFALFFLVFLFQVFSGQKAVHIPKIFHAEQPFPAALPLKPTAFPNSQMPWK